MYEILYCSKWQCIDNNLIDSYHKKQHEEMNGDYPPWPSLEFFKIFEELTKNLNKSEKLELMDFLKNKPNSFSYLFEYDKDKIRLTINLLEVDNEK